MPRIKRILLGGVEISRLLYDLADAFRHLGYQADTIVLEPNRFHPNLEYDFYLNEDALFAPGVFRWRNRLARKGRNWLSGRYAEWRQRYFLTAYDLYIFQCGVSLLPDNRDYPLLKQRGKKIISVFLGSDIRHWSAYEPVQELFALKAYSFYRELKDPLSRRLQTLRIAERYADVMYAQPSYAGLCVRPYMHMYLAMNLSLYKSYVPTRDVPVVVHAPSHREKKGTREILAVLDRLKSEGLQFELRLLENMPNAEVIRTLTEADILVDELNESHFGILAVEAMASGCAVACGNWPALMPLPPDRPVLHINPDNVYAQLRRLITDKVLRVQLAQAGLVFVQKYHDHLNVARDMLRSVESARCDYYPEYFARDYHVPDGEVISENLKRMTAEIVQRHGLPDGVDPQDMIAHGLMSGEGLGPIVDIPRWQPFPAFPRAVHANAARS